MPANHIDVTLSAPLGKKTRLRVTPEQVHWGDHTVTLARVEHVACYWAEMSVNLVRGSRHFQCWFADDRDEVSISTGAGRVPSQEHRLAEASAALEEAMFETVVPRLVEAAAAQLRDGAAVTIGGREVIKAAVSGGVSGGIPGLIGKRRRSRTASTVKLSTSGIELHGEKKTKNSWEWATITGISIDQGKVLLAAEGKKTPLLPLTYRDAVLLPQLVQAALSP